jgi:Type II secretion system protein C
MFDVAIRLLGGALKLGAVILAAWWLTQLTAPRPVARLPSTAVVEPENGMQKISRIFGVGETQSRAMEGLLLTGVFAGSKGGGFATFHTRTGEVSAFTGDEVAPGVTLKQIERDRVILLTAGVQKELLLSDNSAPVAASSGRIESLRERAVASPGRIESLRELAAKYRRRAAEK